MKKFKLLVLFAGVALVFSGGLYAQDTASQNVTMTVNEIVVIDVSGNPAELIITAPTLGGDPPQDASDDTTYAQYTSVVASGTTRSLTAMFGSGSAPTGTNLLLTVTPQGGNRGTTAGQITVTDTAQPIVTTISSCATGRGAVGAQLGYVLEVDTVSDLVAGASSAASITLTLTDDS